MANEAENQIVVYQPNETVRLDVRLENETVWLTQSQMGELFGCTTRNVRLHLENIYSCGELLPEATRKDFFLVRIEGSRQVRRTVTCYNLDAIISVGSLPQATSQNSMRSMAAFRSRRVQHSTTAF